MVARPTLRLNAEQLVMFQNHFKLVDTDANGFINQPEFRTLYRSFGQTISNKRLDVIVAEVFKDAPPEGIGFEAFMDAFMNNFSMPPSEKAVREALMLFDKNNTGYINKRELVTLLTTRGEKLEQSEVNDLFELLGIPQNTPTIDYVTFVEEIYRMIPILPAENS